METVNDLWQQLKPIFLNCADARYFVAGSTRLGVADKSSDIDMVITVTPDYYMNEIESIKNSNNLNNPNINCFTRATLLNPNIRQNLLLAIKKKLETIPNVNNLVCITEAKVPLLSLVYKGIEFDVVISVVIKKNKNLPFELNNLRGIDADNDMSLGGPRHTEFILDHVKDVKAFGEALTLIRQWAKSRVLYGSKYGFFGGVSLSLMTAFIAHFESDTKSIVRMFFRIFSNWNWSGKIVTLTPLLPSHIPKFYTMCLMTPVEPIINTAATVNRWSFQIIQEELIRASRILSESTDGSDGSDGSDGVDRFNEKLTELLANKSKEEFLRWAPFNVFVTYENRPENDIVAAKLLRLTGMLQKPPYSLRTVIFPKVLNDDDCKNCRLAMALGPMENVHNKGDDVVILPVLLQWKQDNLTNGPNVQFELAKRPPKPSKLSKLSKPSKLSTSSKKRKTITQSLNNQDNPSLIKEYKTQTVNNETLTSTTFNNNI